MPAVTALLDAVSGRTTGTSRSERAVASPRCRHPANEESPTINDMCDGPHKPPEPSAGSLWQNFAQSDLPLPARLRAFTLNTLRKARTRQGCCGHYGEPGC